MTEPGKGYAFAVTSALFSGTNYVIGKVVLVELSPEHLVTMIFSIAAVLQCFWVFQSGEWRDLRHWSGKGWAAVLVFSGLSVAALWTLWAGVKHLDPSVAAFISRLQTPVTIFLGIWFLKERFRFLEAIGGLIVLAGVVILYATSGVQVGFWFWVMVSSGVIWGVTEVVAKIALRYVDATLLSFVRTALVAIVYLLFMAVQETPLLHLGRLWVGVLAIALMGPTLARWFYLFALKRLAVSKAALVNQIQPIFVALIAFTFLGTIPTLREWIGGLMILAGCFALIGGKGRIRNSIRYTA